MKHRRLLLVIIFLFFISSVKIAHAENLNCENRYVTFVNPIRSREHWINKSILPLTTQYESLAKHNLPATWLLQYDALKDIEIIEVIKNFSVIGERGVFLEVSNKLTEDSGVPYPQGVRWSDPGAVFLSAYSPSQRRTIIDHLYSEFKEEFGNYPKSIGAWWIDSYSVNYIKNKYGLDSVMIVADQKTTDDYGVWGQWWGVPYYPSSSNILIPGIGKEKQDIVVIQWAQRDPIKAYGEGPIYSNFSLQANDYIRSGKDINYFSNIVSKYLDCKNDIGQITIGMETGMEAYAFQSEYENQLEILSQIPTLNAVTMGDFTNFYRRYTKENFNEVFIEDWKMTPLFRENDVFKERVEFRQGISFGDYFVSDRGGFLNRNLNTLSGNKNLPKFPWLFVIIGSLITPLILKRKYSILIWAILFSVCSYGLILRTHNQFGWQVFYGPYFNNPVLVQVLLIIISFVLSTILFILKKLKLFVWLIPLSYGMDWIINLFRYTNMAGVKYFGLFLDKFHFIGLSCSKLCNFISETYSPNLSGAFLRFPFDKIFESKVLSLFIYPIAHIALATFIYLIIRKLPKKIIIAILIILGCLLIFQFISVFNNDPRAVFPVK